MHREDMLGKSGTQMKQAKHAHGGKYDYVINGHTIGGFALVAWPAEWGNSGVMTFIVNRWKRFTNGTSAQRPPRPPKP